MSIINLIINVIYRTQSAVDKFNLAHPDERVITASGVKGVKSTPKDNVDTGAKWIVSRRAVAILTDKRIKVGDWDIPLSSIQNVELINLNGLISKGQLLNITCDNNIGYQLGMQYNDEWLNSENLKLNYVDKKIKISTFSWIIRIGLVFYICYLLYKRFLM